ncbi:MAG: Rrf2 family transcriptional regulator [Phycisphaerae bacterium]
MFSQTGEYALRAVTYITQHGADRAVLAQDIATHARIPHRYLQKLLTELVRNNVLSSTRGVGGGFRLGRPAISVRLLDVVAPFEDVDHWSRWPLEDLVRARGPGAAVRRRWRFVVEGYKSFLETTTLADLVSPTTKSS